jgi:hypothetical protein
MPRPSAQKKNARNAATASNKAKTAGRPMELQTKLRNGYWVVIPFGQLMDPAAMRIIGKRGAYQTILSIFKERGCYVFQGSKETAKRIIGVSGDFRRLNGSTDFLRAGGENSLANALDSVQDAVVQATHKLGLSQGLIVRKKQNLVLVTMKGACTQPPHFDSDPALVENFVTTSKLKKKNAADPHCAIPLSALCGLDQSATVLMGRYDADDEREIFDEDKEKRRKVSEVELERVHVPAWHMLLFRQDKVHAGDTTNEAVHVRAHMYFDSPDVVHQPSTTLIVADEIAAKYYRVPSTQIMTPYPCSQFGCECRTSANN